MTSSVYANLATDQTRMAVEATMFPFMAKKAWFQFFLAHGLSDIFFPIIVGCMVVKTGLEFYELRCNYNKLEQAQRALNDLKDKYNADSFLHQYLARRDEIKASEDQTKQPRSEEVKKELQGFEADDAVVAYLEQESRVEQLKNSIKMGWHRFAFSAPASGMAVTALVGMKLAAVHLAPAVFSMLGPWLFVGALCLMYVKNWDDKRNNEKQAKKYAQLAEDRVAIITDKNPGLEGVELTKLIKQDKLWCHYKNQEAHYRQAKIKNMVTAALLTMVIVLVIGAMINPFSGVKFLAASGVMTNAMMGTMATFMTTGFLAWGFLGMKKSKDYSNLNPAQKLKQKAGKSMELFAPFNKPVYAQATDREPLLRSDERSNAP